LVAFRNGLLDISCLLTGPPALEPKSPLWFSRVAFPYDYNPGAKAPKWLKFLDRVLEGDQERIQRLQEWFG
jgi:phage/plasmid-associated DNA primase